MDFNACIHRASDNYCYALNETSLVVNLKTGYEVDQVYIHYGDPYEYGILGGNEGWHGVREEIVFRKRLKHQIWWTTTVHPKFKRMKYYFELITKNETFYYFEDGFLTKDQMEIPGKTLQCFVNPWLNPVDVNKTPKWVNDTVWYQIFPDRFHNGNTENDPMNTKAWQHGAVTNEQSYGGDLEGIIAKLGYLKDLGVNGIYLTPIFEATTSHKYDTTNYKKIDPQFGTNETFALLVKKAHEHGIRIMCDGVFNHSGSKFAPWLDVLAKGKESKYFDWFMINTWPLASDMKNTKDGSYYSFAFVKDMPKLNTNNPEVIDYFVDVCEFWIKEFDIDAIRLDVANETSHRFNKALHARLKQLKPDFYILGEIWHDAMHWLRGDEFDSVMNYPLTNAIQDFWVDPTQTKKDFEYAINRCYTMYMQQTNDVLFNLLDSHDTVRLITKTQSLDVFYQQLAILFTMPGSPSIYYGTEIALEGKHDPDCRRCMPWSTLEEEENKRRIHMIKELIALRITCDASKSLHFHFPNTIENTRVLEYIKIAENGDKIEVILNCSDEPVSADFSSGILVQRGYENKQIRSGGFVIRRI